MENKNALTQVNTENKVTEKLLLDYLSTTNGNLQPKQQAQFLAVAQAFNLNPWKREIYAVPYKDKFNVIVGYEVYLKRAEEFPQYDGYETQINGKGDEMSCTCIVYRKDRNHPTKQTVYLSEYRGGEYTLWSKKPKMMLEKVAISTALRRAFPLEFGGMPYTKEELDIEEQNTLDKSMEIKVENTPIENEVKEQKENKKEPNTSPLDEKESTDFLTFISQKANILGSKRIEELLNFFGGLDKIKENRQIVRQVCFAMENEVAKLQQNQEEVEF